MKNALVLVIVAIVSISTFSGCFKTQEEVFEECSELALEYATLKINGIEGERTKDAFFELNDYILEHAATLRTYFRNEKFSLLSNVKMQTFRNFLAEGQPTKAHTFLSFGFSSSEKKEKQQLIMEFYDYAMKKEQLWTISDYIGQGWIPLNMEMRYAKKRIEQIKAMRGIKLLDVKGEYSNLRELFDLEQWNPSTDPWMYELVFAMIQNNRIDTAAETLYQEMHIFSIEDPRLEKILAIVPMATRGKLSSRLSYESKKTAKR